MMLVGGIGGALAAVVKQEAGLAAIFNLAVQILSFWLGLGLMRITLKIVRDEPAEINELWKGGPYLIQYVIGTYVVSFVVCLGLILLIIPGIIWGLSYTFVQYILAEEKISFSIAMAESKQMTQGIKWKLVKFTSALLGLNLLGCLPFFIGLIVTIPVTTIASFVLYVELRRQYLAQVATQATSANLTTQPVAVAMQSADETKLPPEVK